MVQNNIGSFVTGTRLQHRLLEPLEGTELDFVFGRHGDFFQSPGVDGRVRLFLVDGKCSEIRQLHVLFLLEFL
jgi:hypothetical protein